MRGYAGLQKGNQLRLHEGVVVWNVKADDARLAEVAFETPGQLGAMCFFHDKHDIGAGDMLGCQRIDGVMVESGGPRFDIGV